MMIRGIKSENFPPFGRFTIEFPPIPNKPPGLSEVHLFTGTNGTGKTRLLAALAALLGCDAALRKRLKGEENVLLHFTDAIGDASAPWLAAVTMHRDRATVNAGTHGKIAFRANNWIDNLSQMPAFAFSGVPYVVDTQLAVMGDLTKPTRGTCLSFARTDTDAKSLMQGIANLKVRAGMDSLKPSSTPKTSVKLLLALEGTISNLTGIEFAFTVENFTKLALGVEFGGVKMSIDSLPDGLRSIIGWLAQAIVGLQAWLGRDPDPAEENAIFLLDEVEAFLHPAWQRQVLPAFQRLFPKAQMFVATHSPFVISSLNHGWIHKFTRAPSGNVETERLPASEGDSYLSALETVLGVTEWFDTETEALLSQFRTMRNSAYHGDIKAADDARTLAARIGRRSIELQSIMGNELAQMDRQLTKSSPQ